MAGDRRYSEREYQIVVGQALPPARLAQIWAGLPERERLGFIHSLDEDLADRVIAATVKYAPPARQEPAGAE